jgi:serine/threonine protein kinase
VEIYHNEVLGIGAYGKVCKAKCGQLPCAAKLLHDTLFQDIDLTTRFLQECEFLSNIKHPNIVQYLGTTNDPQSRRSVLLMELMDESLTRFLEKLAEPLPYHTQLNICYDVALALDFLHSNDIIHRDLSSNNILLIGAGSRAKVTDFGMSKLVDMNPRITPLTQAPGTLAYMPPEALITPPHYSNRLDCFSHGVLTLQIATRQFPNPGSANRYREDSNYPTGRVLEQFPEIQRRKDDIDLIEPSHPLLPTALDSLKDRDTERPSARELCNRLASLRKESWYARASTDRNTSIQRLLHDVEVKERDLSEQAELSRIKEELAVQTERQVELELESRHWQEQLERERVEHRRDIETREPSTQHVIDDCRVHSEKQERRQQELQVQLEAMERRLGEALYQRSSGDRMVPQNQMPLIPQQYNSVIIMCVRGVS